MEDPLYLVASGVKPSDKLEEVCAANSRISSTANETNSLKTLQNDLLRNKLSQFLHDCAHSSVNVEQKMLPVLPSVSDLATPGPHQTSSICKSQCMALSTYKSSDTTYSKDQAVFNTVMLALWHAKRWEQIMNMIAADDSEQGLVLNSITFLTSALAEKQHSFDPIQKQAYKFLAGISAMIQNNPVLAQSLISQAYFGELPHAMGEEALSILAIVATKIPGCLNLYDELKVATLQGIINHEHQNPNSKLSALLPTDKELSPPKQVSSRLSGMLKSKDFNCLIKEKEEKILEGEGIYNEEKVGNSYLDLMQSCRGHLLESQMRSKACVLTYEERLALNRDCSQFGIDINAMRVGCLIVAALWFLKKLQRETNSKQKATTLKKKIHKCLEDAFTLVQSKHMDPGMKVYVSRMCAGATLASICCTEDTTSVDELNFLLQLFQSLNEISCLTPFWSIPSVSVYETTLLSYNLGRLHSGFTLHLLNLSPEARTVNHKQLMHQLYENHFTGLLSLQNPEQTLTEASEIFLREKNQTLDDVAQLLHSPFTPCDVDGWPNHLSNSRHKSMQYATIDGFIINLHADAVTIDVKCQAVEKGKGVFSENDLRLSFAVLASMDNPMNLTFSLDPLSGEQYPLFQELRFDPLQLEDTPIGQIMLEVDYLLKQLTTGSEISCKPPFHQRPSCESLTKILPPHLRKGLQPPKPNSRFSSHRFWIKAEEIDYELLNNNTIKIGEVKMVVHHHPQKQCADGRRCDTEQEDPNSDESKFASFFTEHFDELTTYYPILARLKELCKIQLVAKIVKEKLHLVVQSTTSIGKMGLVLVSIIPTFVAYGKYIQTPSKTRSQKQKKKSRSIKYVPSTFFRGRNQRCTGGVVLQPKLNSMTSQQHRTYICGKCSTAPTSSTQAVRSVDQILHESSSQIHQSHFNMPRTKFSGTKSVDQILHDDSYSAINEMQESSNCFKATRSIDQALHDDQSLTELEQSSSTENLEYDCGSEGTSTRPLIALAARNPIVSVCAAAATDTKNSGASASKPVSSQNTSRAIKGVNQILHDQASLAQRQNPHYPRSRAHATKSIDQFMHDNPSYLNKMHEARFKGDSFQATKSMDQILHDDQGNPVCEVCSCPVYPHESTTSTMYPKGVKLAPMITCKQISVATSTSRSHFEGCTSVYLKLGSTGPSIEQLKLVQPVQNIPWKSKDCVQATSWKNPQPLNESSPSFTVNTNKWKHLYKQTTHLDYMYMNLEI